ncbi:YjgN family protein [Leisingera sp. SS27]|uniref:YjgN family protein n=1 Tax=Leisingera sp. SS27 TaxID=2979462 RepID=UPI002330C00C|nr:YjgN family protein [Leisingera sp. SS27]MDC0658822.1 YjgN family protein [Leisingera sp. SS27]
MSANISEFEFRGNAKEWFGIWIVNLLLSILTLGIYSAWAKVRRHKYFYNNTYVEGRNFDYHATGGQIFVGRLIVFGAFVIYNLILTMVPMLAPVLLLALVLILPWLIIRAMMFNARMTSFSNVRFGFSAGYGKAFLVYLIYPILTALTAYLTFPLLDRAVKRFSIDNHRLGTAAFHFEAPLGPFYKAFFAALAWVVIVGAAVFALMGATVMTSFQDSFASPNPDPSAVLLFMAGFYGIFFLAFLPAVLLYHAMTRNAVYNNTVLEGGHQFRSDISAGALLWLAVTNLVAVVCSLGLLLPWAQVRMVRYLTAHTGVVLGSSLDSFVDVQGRRTSAVGDAYTDFEGIDVGLPV